MSERAKRASQVLRDRGWSVGDTDDKDCPRCGASVKPAYRYCAQCGEKLLAAHFDDSTVQDLEAAIAAAQEATTLESNYGIKD